MHAFHAKSRNSARGRKACEHASGSDPIPGPIPAPDAGDAGAAPPDDGIGLGRVLRGEWRPA